jgi:hypothetical protein
MPDFTELWQSTQFLSVLAGAAVAALSGGVVAWVLQRQSVAEARKDKTEHNKLTQQVLAHSLLFKMIRIHSDFLIIRTHLESHCKDSTHDELWQNLIPLRTLPPPIHFSADEMGMLLSLKDDEVFNCVMPLDGLHNSLTDIAKLYSDKRERLTQRLPNQTEQGNPYSSALSLEHVLAFRPLINELNSMVAQMREFTAQDVARAGKALERLQALLETRLGIATKFTCLDEEPAEMAIAPGAGSAASAPTAGYGGELHEEGNGSAKPINANPENQIGDREAL